MAAMKPATRKATATGNGATTAKTAPIKLDESLDFEVSRNLRLLKAILDAPTPSNIVPTKPRRPKTPLATTMAKQTNAARTVPPKSKNGKQVIETREVAASEPLPSPVEQMKLAMNSFNQSLKFLSAAARKRQLDAEPNVREETNVTRNQPDNGSTPDIDICADCACVALDLLRHTEEAGKVSEDSVERREQGAVLLLEKLISLAMEERATKVAVKIHDQYWKRRNRGKHEFSNRRKPTHFDLPQLLMLDDNLEFQRDFSMVCSFQSQILRLAMLQGPKSVTQNFVRAISIDTEGSPPNVLTSGREMGYIEKRRAGDNLRTVAQALSKLYSTTVKSTCPSAESNPQTMSLFVEAQIIRLTSWKMLERQADLEQDLWIPLERALRHLWHKQTQKDEDRYALTKRLVARVELHLRVCKFCSEQPAKLSDFLAQLAEVNGDHDEAAKLITELARTATGASKLFYQCRLATIQLVKTGVEKFELRCVNDVFQSFDRVSHKDLNLSPDNLLSVVRLRNACSQQISLAAVANAGRNEANFFALCLRLLFAIMEFCTSQLQETCQKDAKLRRSLYLAVLKTVETVIGAEKYATRTEGAFLEQYLHTLDSCSTSLTKVAGSHGVGDEDSQATVLISLKIRLSNVFWRAHLNSEVVREDGIAIACARKSIACLDGIPNKDLGKAALGPRLEKIASMHVAGDAPHDALAVLWKAIRHYIATDALADAVEASLSKQSGQVWTDPASLASQLGRALHSYNTISGLEDDVEDQVRLLYDDEKLPDIHRAVLLEHQILRLLRKSPRKKAFEILLRHAQLVTKLACLPGHGVWRLRFASAFAFHASKVRDFNEEDMAKIGQLLSTAQKDCVDHKQPFLEPYKPILESLVHLQCGIITGTFDSTSREQGLARLLSIIQNRSSLTELDEVVNDYDCLLSYLRATTDQAMALYEDATAVLCLKARLHLMLSRASGEEDEQVNCYIKLARCQTRLDDLAAAESSLNNARKLLETCANEDCASLELHLASAELCLASSSTTALSNCKLQLHHAQKDFEKYWSNDDALSSVKQIQRDNVIARGALLASQFAVRAGNLTAAIHYARQTAKISISIWAALQKRKLRSDTSREGSTRVSLVDDLSKLNITSRPKPIGDSPLGVRHWPSLEVHIGALTQAFLLLSHVGQFDDAFHYIKQLKQAVSCIPSSHLSLNTDLVLALLYAKSGREGDARELLSTREAKLDDSCSAVTMNDILTCSEAYIALGDLDTASRFLQKLPSLDSASSIADDVPKTSSLEEETRLTIKARRGLVKAKPIKTPARRHRNAHENEASITIVKDATRNNTSCFSFNKWLNEDRRVALLLMLSTTEKAIDQDLQSETHITSPRPVPPGLVQEVIAIAKSNLSKAWQKLCADSMQSVLIESAVGLPSKYISSGRNARVSFLQGVADKVNISPSKVQGQPNQLDSLFTITKLLQSAHRSVNMLLTEQHSFCSTETIHALVKMDARISLLLTTMDRPFTFSSTDLVLKLSEPKDHSLDREKIIAFAESATHERCALSIWPTLAAATNTVQQTITASYLSGLPSSWSVISFTLAEDNDELLMAKIVSGRSPFLIRIPLRRSNEGDGIDEFIFNDARKEMENIIGEANSSSHDTRAMSDKATRAQWHADREALDRRLEMLLSNIESIWLGGFRGLLSPDTFDQKQVRQFGNALSQSLETHLPSRQKSGTGAGNKFDIHDHILEIFLGLGNPEEVDLDDEIIDLLYFVVDILQFSGERNAYDEIDWDAMLVDVIDSLRACHEARTPQQCRHTILVLDKELESFPWESLPCLIDRPVSRMPSLGSIFDRLSLIEAQHEDSDALVISKSTATTTSIINPSGDLTSTQAVFEPILADSLPAQQYASLIHTPPTESQFSSMLSSSDILLYFGHGSGAQYIRGRTIRSLPKSAVTFLFGCSSTKMTEHGAFESTGMPRYYMLGNSPAVVGCLWDVTDREIDRVALKTMSGWGLVDREDERVREGLKKKGKKSQKREKTYTAQRSAERKNLVEAVQEGRQACVLRYLCGAAVVVYGVPVVLEH